VNAVLRPDVGQQPVLARDCLDRARAIAAATGVSLLEAFEEASGMPPAEFTRTLARSLHLAPAGMDELHRMAPVFDLLPYTDALQRDCILLRTEDGPLVFVFADPFDDKLRPWVEERVRQPMVWMLAHRADIAAYLARHEESMRAMDDMLRNPQGRAVGGADINDLSLKSISEDTSPVVKLVHSTLYDALKSGASDIHLETSADTLAIKYRVDGVLIQVGNVSGIETAEQVISRIKVMSELDISERRTPQDGRFKISMRGRQIDFRVSVMPSIHGEDAVLRILDKQALTDDSRQT
jgi:general secretion pathway protein E